MFMVNGLRLDGDAGLVQLLDLAQREVTRSFADALAGDPPTAAAGLALPRPRRCSPSRAAAGSPTWRRSRT